jgi:hypothetical protein
MISRLFQKYLIEKYEIRLAILLLLSLFLAALVLVFAQDISFPPVDFITFWSGTRIFLAGGNPYNPQQLATLQAPFGAVHPEMTTFWYLPWTLAFFAPFGYFAYFPSLLSWSLFSLFLVLAASALLGKIYGVHPIFGILIALSFAPLLMTLTAGQVSAVMLAALALFLYAGNQNKDWLAGAALAFVSFKPQVLFLFWVALFLWLVQTRRWRILLSFASIVILGTAIAVIVNPSAVLGFLSVDPGVYHIPPTIASLIGGPTPVILPALGLAILIWSWYKHHCLWIWSEQLPWLVAVSLTLTPLAWSIDHVLLLAVLIPMIAHRRWMIWPYAGLSGVLWLLLFVSPGRHERFLWVPLAILMVHLISAHREQILARFFSLFPSDPSIT